MKICLYQNVTQHQAVRDMFSAIDNSDFSIDHVVIVPDRFSLLSEKLLLNILPSKALFNVRVENLTSFTVELLSRLKVNLSDVLSNGEVLLLTQKAIEKVKNQLKTFKKCKIAFSYEISKLLSQFKSCGLEPESLNENAEGMIGEKYKDLKLIYSEYQRLLEGKLDANERLGLLNKNLTDSKVLDNTKLYFAGFDAFTKEGYNFIKNLVPLAKEVNFSVTKSYDFGNEYIYDNDVFNKIKQIAKECEASIKVFEGKKILIPQREAIIRGVYSYSKITKENDGFYNLYSCQSLSEEVEAVCRWIRYAVYSGKKFKDIQIAVSDLDRYQSQIENFFDKYDIPYYIDSSVTADQTLLGRLVVEFLDAVSFGFNGDRLIGLLSNVLIGENGDLIDRCQKLGIDSTIKYKKFIEWDFPFADIARALEKCKNSVEFGNKILELLGRVLATFDEVMRKLDERGYLKEKNINLQAFDIIKETIELINKYSCEETDIDEYSKKLKLLLSFKQVSTVPTFVDGVMIGDATASFFDESDSLIIMGGQDLPIVSLDNGLLSDEEMGLNIKEIEPTIRMINRRNRFKIFSLLSLAKNQLIIFYQMMSQEGKKNELPSFVTNLNNIFNQLELRAGNIFFSNYPATAERALLSTNFSKNDENLIKKDNFCYKNREKLEIFPKKLMFNDDKVKVTQLEQYYSCPFKHFASYGLKLQENVRSQIDAKDIGNICHKGAEYLIKELKKTRYNFDIDVDKFIEENISNFIDEGLKDRIDVLEERQSFLRYIKRQLKCNFMDIIRELKKSSFRPKFLEKSLKSYIVDVDGERYNLIGRADRIDECGGYFRIIDYKTGNTGSLLKELYFGEKLQLFLYQRMAKDELNKIPAGGFYFNSKLDYSQNDEDNVILKGIAPNDENVLQFFDCDLGHSGISSILSLYKNSDGEYKGSSISKFSLERLQNYSVEIAKKGIKRILEGYITPKPNSKSCNYCPYSSFCGHESVQGLRKNSVKDVKFNQ